MKKAFLIIKKIKKKEEMNKNISHDEEKDTNKRNKGKQKYVTLEDKKEIEKNYLERIGNKINKPIDCENGVLFENDRIFLEDHKDCYYCRIINEYFKEFDILGRRRRKK